MSNSNLSNPSVPFNPEILRWARESLNLSVEEVAQRMKKTADDVEAWERGDASPTYVQLEKLAYKIYKRPLALFFFPEVPDEEPIQQAFRTLPKEELQRLPPRMILLMRKARVLQMNLSELYEGRNPSAHLIWRSLRFGHTADPDEMAEAARNYLGVDLSEQQSWMDNDLALKRWRRALEDCGVFVFKDSFRPPGRKSGEEAESGESLFSGFCLHDDEFPVIYVNNNHAKTRQIFTLFHELAHLLIGESGVLPDYGREIVYSNDAKWIEPLCNRFAAEFLVPAEDFKARSEGHAINDETIEKWAAFYSVSRETILRRLYDWKFVSGQEYNEKVQQWRRQWEKKKEEQKENRGKKEKKAGGMYYLTKIAYLGKKYIETVFERYDEGRITIDEAAEYLDVKIENISKLETSILGKNKDAT